MTEFLPEGVRVSSSERLTDPKTGKKRPFHKTPQGEGRKKVDAMYLKDKQERVTKEFADHPRQEKQTANLSPKAKELKRKRILREAEENAVRAKKRKYLDRLFLEEEGIDMQFDAPSSTDIKGAKRKTAKLTKKRKRKGRQMAASGKASGGMTKKYSYRRGGMATLRKPKRGK